MEFPELGSHCSVPTCNRLDFLPFQCDACQKIFCTDHRTYDQHNCTEPNGRNIVVPTCPLCQQPVPVMRGEDPNIKVNNHIQQECKSDKAKKLYTNKCSFPGCKKKELVPVTCNICRQNFCLKHRFETNHNCQGPLRTRARTAGGVRNTPGQARQSGAVRSKPSTISPQSTALTHIGADLNRERLQRQQQRQQAHSSRSNALLSEDEAIRLAIAASLSDQSLPQQINGPHNSQGHAPKPDSEDEALARAIAASLNEQTRPKPKTKPPPQRQSSDCLIS